MSPALALKLRESSVEVRDLSSDRRGARRSGGAGVIWTADGTIVTNAHVVRSQTPVVTLPDGREFSAVIVRRDRERDLAVLKIDSSGLPAAQIGDSAKVRVGQMVTAVGNPLGLIGAVTTGVIHAIDERNWIQADVCLAPGNSGGLLADAQGRVIGINTMIYAGLAFAVPSNAASAMVSGDVDQDKPLLGISLKEVHVQRKPAVLVLEVLRGSKAEQAGLMLGDVLLISAARLHAEIAKRGTLSLELLRGGISGKVAIDLSLVADPTPAPGAIAA